MNLPGKAGWELINEVRLVDTLPIIIMSGRNPTEPEIQHAVTKANDYQGLCHLRMSASELHRERRTSALQMRGAHGTRLTPC